MANTIYHLDLANLFVGDDDPTNSQYLTLKGVTLPQLTERTKTHSPGGGVMDITLGLRKMNELSVPFKLEGINPDVLSRFMPAGLQRIKYTIRGNMRDVLNHADLPIVAVVEGRMIQANINEIGSGNTTETDYQISEIVRYQLTINAQEKFRFDFMLGAAGVWIDGVQVFQTAAANLGLAF